MNPAPSSSGSPMNSHAGVIGSDLLLGIGEKPCNKCGVVKPLEMFPRGGKAKSGRRGQCLECQRKYLKTWYAENKARQIEKSSQWQAENKEHRQDYMAKYRAENLEHLQAKEKSYGRKHRTEKRKYLNQYKADLRDGYVRQLLTENTDLSPSDIPQDLVDLKRVHVKLKRILKDNQP